MSKTIMITGLPGSGKTRLANSLGLPVVDDISRDIFKNLAQYRHCDVVITDPMAITASPYRVEKHLEKFLDQPVEFWVFENDYDQCVINSNARLRSEPSRTVDGLLRYLTKNFNQEWFVRADRILPVWR